MTTNIAPLPPTVKNTIVTPPPLPRRIRLKLKRIYLDLTGPRLEREWRRVWPLIDSVEGWLSEGQEHWLFESAYSLPEGAVIVEIGSFKGRSTCCFAFGCRGTRKRVFAVDTFDGNDCDFPERAFLKEFSENINRCGLSQYVEPVVGISHQVARGWNRPINLLFIDGSHRYEDVVADFEGFFPHVVAGGIVAFHDVVEDKPGPLRAWHEVAKKELVDIGYCKSLAYGRKPGAGAK